MRDVPGMNSPYRLTHLDSLSGDEVARFYANYLDERSSVPFGAAEREYLDDPKILGRIVDPASRQFFAYHVGARIARLVSALVADRQQPKFLDLGCGSGTVALMLALGGARVIGIDRNPVAVAACRRRQTYYESHFGPLALEFHVGDALAFPYADTGPFDGVYSAFAFNMMQPPEALLDKVVPALAPGGRLVLADGNKQSVVNRVLRPHAGLSPRELQVALETRGLTMLATRFGGLIPPALARLTATRSLAEEVERLTPSGLFAWAAASYTLVAEKPPLPLARRHHHRESRRTQERALARESLVRYPRPRTRVPGRSGERAGPGPYRSIRLERGWLHLVSRRRALGLSAVATAAVVAAVCAFTDACLVGVCC